MDPQDAAAIVVICTRVLVRLPETAPLVAARIRAARTEYQVVPIDDHISHVTEQQARLVQALMESRPPSPEDLVRAAALGRLRASQGVSVEAVIGAFHIGNRALWDSLVEQSGHGGHLLPGLATLMWESIEVMSSGIAAAHSSVSRSRQARDLTIRHRFVELLALEDVGLELREIAVALGFDPDGSFKLAVARTGEPDGPWSIGEEESGLGAKPDGAPPVRQGAACWSRVGENLAVVAQGELGEGTIERLRATSGLRVGIGLNRAGLAGAAASLVDARRTLALTGPDRPTADFAEDWAAATILADARRLQPVIEPHRATVAGNPHLVEALASYAAAGGSVTAAARLLHVHPNTIAYRLDRWAELTSWDPRTHTGLVNSLWAVRLADAE